MDASVGSFTTHSLWVVHLYPLVDEITLKDRGDEIVPDAFDLIHAFWVGLIHAFWNREIAPHRVHADDLAARHCLLDLPGDTCDGTAGTRSEHKHVQLTALPAVEQLVTKAAAARASYSEEAT